MGEMPEYRTPALVLRTFDQGESDRIVHLYTEALGRVHYVSSCSWIQRLGQHRKHQAPYAVAIEAHVAIGRIVAKADAAPLEVRPQVGALDAQ